LLSHATQSAIRHQLLLALRGRPTPALHTFHHAATLILCWSQLVDDTAAQVVPIALNLAVHVAMYFYYALATLGRDVWWKRHLTRAQIIQFAADVPACGLALLLRVNAERGWGWLGGATHCRGTHRAAYAGIGLLAAYLALFIKLYVDTYVKRTRVPCAKKTS
jgi:fatty acid elongase 3